MQCMVERSAEICLCGTQAVVLQKSFLSKISDES
jgi:hypothetical protein